MKKNALHLSIIPDGNRRWAKARKLLPWNGHEKAIENFRSITDWCHDHPRVGVLTVWCFSTENWNRDKTEVKRLMKILEDYLRNERGTFIKNKTRFLHTGRLDRLPASLSTLIRDVCDETKDFSDFTVNLAVDYGGKDEIIRALRRISQPTSIQSEEDFRQYLDHPELQDIDIVVRTSGEHRTSNFFLWESAYAEWIFLEKYFPDLTTDDLEDALKEFDHRKRRFGS